MMLTHNWFDQLHQTDQAAIKDLVAGAVQFDCGDANELPKANGIEFMDSRPPFPVTLLQFEMNVLRYSHVLCLWHELDDGNVRITLAFKHKDDGSWASIAPRVISRNGDEVRYLDETGMGAKHNQDIIEMMHAQVMRFFDVLACSNVATITTPPLTALNKKRAKAGKFPILEYKTLTIIVDEPRSVNDPQGGAHASPRVHLRRGHIRRITPEKRVWVQPCVVGSNHGMVLKDYRVRAMATA